jgi:DNA-binding LacI/PurR family transcriptional regulator
MPATLKQIAIACDVSTATVSRALAGRAYVRTELREEIRAQAVRLGYAPNRLVGSLMAHVRRARADQFLGNLAVVHVPSVRRPSIGPQVKRIIDSACQRARDLGFAAEIFELQAGARGDAALARVLKARGVAGAVLVYPEPSEAPVRFPWEEFSVVAIDLARQEPMINTVCHDQYVSMLNALTVLRTAGYKQAGLFIEHFKDARTNFKWSAAMQSFQARQRGIGDVPILMEQKMGEAAFATWWRRHKPDVVIGHFDNCVGWLEQLRRRVPEHVGFFNLNWLGRSRPCAGIDPQLELQGRVAAETLISQIQHGERGLPATPRLISVPGRLVTGPSVRS